MFITLIANLAPAKMAPELIISFYHAGIGFSIRSGGAV